MGRIKALDRMQAEPCMSPMATGSGVRESQVSLTAAAVTNLIQGSMRPCEALALCRRHVKLWGRGIHSHRSTINGLIGSHALGGKLGIGACVFLLVV